MKFRVILLILIALLLYNFSLFNNNSNLPIELVTKEVKPVTSQINKRLANKDVYSLNSQKTNISMIEFNTMLMSKNGILEEFEQYHRFVDTYRNNPEIASGEILELFENVKKNPSLVESIFFDCINHKGRLLTLEKESTDYMMNQYIFLMGLSDSKVCEHDNSRKIFYAFLNMARAGDKLMQLKLVTNLITAVNRRIINIKTNPLEYMSVRNEIFNYLKILASNGVYYAYLMLHEQYNGNLTIQPMIEPDIILAYYYAYLASMQEPNFPLEYTKIYHTMTTQQQKIANKMVKNL